MKSDLQLNPSDVPILLLGFNRPDFLKKRILELITMQVEHLYISIDGGINAKSEAMKEVISWAELSIKDLKTLIIIENQKNLGLVKHITTSITKVLERHPYVVVVEDDIKLSQNFYSNMLYGLNLQHSRRKKGIVGGFSVLNLSNFSLIRNKWRTSPYTVIWGWGCSKLIWEEYTTIINKETIMDKLSSSPAWNSLSNFQKKVWLGRFEKVAVNPEYTWDIQLQYLSFIKNYENIYPISTITLNEGFSDLRSTNTKNAKPVWMQSKSPDSRKMKNELSTQLTKKIIDIFDSNLFMSDTKLIHLFKHKYKLSIPKPK
jgi:hypothetical protein